MEWEYLPAVENRIEAIRNKALARLQAVNPDITVVVDNHTIDDYCGKQWDYPGKWYCFFQLPDDVHSEEELISKMVAETLACFNKR